MIGIDPLGLSVMASINAVVESMNHQESEKWKPMKPRIKKQGILWLCIAGGDSGIGSCPRGAYHQWSLQRYRRWIVEAKAAAMRGMPVQQFPGQQIVPFERKF